VRTLQLQHDIDSFGRRQQMVVMVAVGATATTTMSVAGGVAMTKSWVGVDQF
jgi:hypothetical protein